MQISSPLTVAKPGGGCIKSVREAVYLGGLLTCDGRATREIARRIGEAGRLFDSLVAVWKHAAITRKRKIDIYESCMLSKLLYSLESLWILQRDRWRLDAFHCRCLRRILRIPPSFVSRVSNQTVLEGGKSTALSGSLIERQKKLYSSIAQLPEDSLVRLVVCDSSGMPVRWAGRRRQGRPRQQCAAEVFKLLEQA